MNSLRRMFCFLFLVSGSSFAQEIIIPNVFSAGDPASAEEVNENFQTLADAINDVSGSYRVITLLSTSGVGPEGEPPTENSVQEVRAMSATGGTNITVNSSGECSLSMNGEGGDFSIHFTPKSSDTLDGYIGGGALSGVPLTFTECIVGIDGVLIAKLALSQEGREGGAIAIGVRVSR